MNQQWMNGKRDLDIFYCCWTRHWTQGFAHVRPAISPVLFNFLYWDDTHRVTQAGTELWFSCLSQLRTWNYILAVLSIPTPPILMALVAPENILITYFYWLRVVSNVTQTLCCWACVYMGGGGRRGDPASSSGSGHLFLLSSQLCLTPAPSPSSRRSGGLPLNHIQQGICSGYQTIHF